MRAYKGSFGKWGFIKEQNHYTSKLAKKQGYFIYVFKYFKNLIK